MTHPNAPINILYYTSEDTLSQEEVSISEFEQENSSIVITKILVPTGGILLIVPF